MYISFLAKAESVLGPENTLKYRRVKVPKLTRYHCDMPGFRKSKRYGNIANSDIFLGVIAKRIKAMGIGRHIRLDCLPEGVSIGGVSSSGQIGYMVKIIIHITDISPDDNAYSALMKGETHL